MAGTNHTSSMRLGDAGEFDLPFDNTTTTDWNPWVELEDTLTFLSTGQPAVRRLGAVQGATRIQGAESVRMF